MRRILPSLVLPVLLLAGAGVGQSPSRGPAPDPNSSWDSYRIIVTRNIFSKDRTVAQPRTRTRYRPAVPREEPSRDAGYVLSGVAVHPTVRIAFFEDTRSGQTVRAGVGQEVGSGTVASISPDGVEYRTAGRTLKVQVGQNLTGTEAKSFAPPVTTSQPAVAVSPGGTSPGSTSPGAASKPSEPVDKSVEAVLERMRQNRLKELGK